MKVCLSQGAQQVEEIIAAPLIDCLISLPSETAALGETGLATSRRAQDGAAVGAGHDCLAVAEYGCDVEAPLALDVHEVAVGGLNQTLQLVL